MTRSIPSAWWYDAASERASELEGERARGRARHHALARASRPLPRQMLMYRHPNGDVKREPPPLEGPGASPSRGGVRVRGAGRRPNTR